ncbi:MAG: 50S ribosomal protein L22 [Actinobacteria bacterium]|nr:50S ribosomal protein L22 [Actinomycetota bacterium]
MARARTTVQERPEVKAQARWLRIAPRKARLVVEHIRGRTVPEARTVLAFTPRAAAREIEKVLNSAVANAEANHGLFGDELIVSAAYVDEGPTVKRWRARARGRASRIMKRTCHVTLRLTPAELNGDTARRRRTQGKAEAPVEPQGQPVVATQEQEKPKRVARTRKPAAAKAEGAEKAKRAPRKKKNEETTD